MTIFKLLQLLIEHRDALFDVLNKTKFDADIPITKFVELVGNLETDLVCNMLSFQDIELHIDDVIEKNLGLYIHINIDGVHVKKI